MKSPSLLILSLLMVTGCAQNEPIVTLINNSEVNYDSIQVFSTPALPTTFTEFIHGEERSGKILFDLKNQSDGAYGLKLYKGDEVIRSRYFGYYTNGASLNRNFKVKIEKDTILVDER